MKFKAREVTLTFCMIIYLFAKTLLVAADDNFSNIMQNEKHRNSLKENRIISMKIVSPIS